MIIRLQKGESPAELSFMPWDVAIVGDAIDARGHAGEDLVKNKAKQVVRLRYTPDDMQVNVDGAVMNAEQIVQYLAPFKNASVVIETSTLGFVEVFLCCRAARTLGMPPISLVYVEPGSYARPRRSHVLHKRDFELSGTVLNYQAIPWATRILDDRQDQKVVFFLGYEERRLDRALNDFSIQPRRCSLVFGVPAFQPGWEMDAFANNIRVIRDKNLEGPIQFCGAENPAGAYGILEDTYRTLASDQQLFVAPIGTKPHGIGAALFVAEHDSVGILYDHPTRKPDRTSATFNWHLFTVEF